MLQPQAGIEAVWQVTVRDRNRVALFGDVIAGAVLGLKNILTLTGDHTALGDHKKGRVVYDIDSTQFAEMLTMMIDEGTDYEGNEVVLTAKGRHDPCVVPRAVPIVEAMTALVLVNAALNQKIYARRPV